MMNRKHFTNLNFKSNKELSYLNSGEMLCYSCFHKRENNAQKTKKEEIMTSNWGLYLIPIVNTITLFSKASKCNNFPDGCIYHIYNGCFDEHWSKNKNCVMFGMQTICEYILSIRKHRNRYLQFIKILNKFSKYNYINYKKFYL